MFRNVIAIQTRVRWLSDSLPKWEESLNTRVSNLRTCWTTLASKLVCHHYSHSVAKVTCLQDMSCNCHQGGGGGGRYRQTTIAGKPPSHFEYILMKRTQNSKVLTYLVPTYVEGRGWWKGKGKEGEEAPRHQCLDRHLLYFAHPQLKDLTKNNAVLQSHLGTS